MRLFAAVVLFLTLSLAYGWNDANGTYYGESDDEWEDSSAGYLQTTCSLIVPALYLLVKSA